MCLFCLLYRIMKKNFFVVLLFSFVFFWCTPSGVKNLDVDAILDLGTLEAKVTELSQKIQDGKIEKELAQNTIEKLQQKYIDLKGTTSTTIENQFANIQWFFVTKNTDTYTIPLWAQKIWIHEPQWMSLDVQASRKTYTTSEGYNSTTLVYTWSYDIALQEAKRIADKAGLFISKDFVKGQELAQNTNTQYISWLDISTLTQWIIYVNHELLDLTPEYSLSVSVDKYGTLTIESSKVESRK